MAPAAVNKGRILRCPVCTAMMSVGAGLIPQATLTCPKCRRKFERQEALPYKPPAPAAPEPADVASARVEASTQVRWSGHIAAAAGGLALTLFLGMNKKGPEFLVFYAIVWAVTFFGSFIFKLWPWGQYAGGVAFVIFEGLGVARIITGMQKGMHKFHYLIILMVIGGFFYLFRWVAERPGGSSEGGCSSGGFWSSWGSSCSSSSISSGSTGGGCGGGGGGCGGCGGGD